MVLRIPALGLVVLVVLAGCLGGTAPATDTASTTTTGPPTTAPTDETTTTTTTTTETTQSNVPTTRTTTTTWTPTTTPVDEKDVVAYENLSAATQRLFDTGLGGSIDRFGVNSTAFRPFVVNDYVRKNGTLYAVEGYRTLRPRTWVGGLVRVDGPVENDSNVVAYANLSASVQADFDALRNGSKASLEYRPDEFPFPGDAIDDGGSYVRLGSEYYRLELAHKDIYEYHLAVENTSED